MFSDASFWGSFLAIYFIAWWITLPLVLTSSISEKKASREITPGTEPGAPDLPNLPRVGIINSLLSAVVTALTLWLYRLSDL